MGILYKETHNYISIIDSDSVFVEIGSEYGEGSTAYFADLATKYNTSLHSVDISTDAVGTVKNENIVWHNAIGSEWCKQYNKINKKISVLYLDNFDYIWDASYSSATAERIMSTEMYNNLKGSDWHAEYTSYKDLQDWVKNEIEVTCNLTYDSMIADLTEKYAQYGLEWNNQNCQIEHFTQLFHLYPYLSDNCTVIFDDTLLHNDCWIGKNGPGVVMLRSLGFNIIKISDSRMTTGVILQRGYNV